MSFIPKPSGSNEISSRHRPERSGFHHDDYLPCGLARGRMPLILHGSQIVTRQASEFSNLRRIPQCHRAAVKPRAIKPSNAELGSGTNGSTPKSPSCSP
jgi:hypothetical protein